MTVYIDQYIIINITLNFFILRITKKIIKSKTSNPRLLFSSIIGALFATLLLIPGTEFLTGFLGKISFSFILTTISFKSSSIKSFLKKLAVFYLTSFIVGGCAYALCNLYTTNEHFNIGKVLCITIFLSYFIINAITSIYEKNFKYDNLIHTLKITLNDKDIEILSLYDTGNNLTDPITKTPVIIVNIKAAKELLPDEIIYAILHNSDIINIYSSYCIDLKLKLIPYNTISDDGLMLGIVPTAVYVDGKETKAIIGISKNIIASDKEYNAILNSQNI